MHVSISKAAIFLGVSISTLRRWEKAGRLGHAFRSLGGHRRYCLATLRSQFGLATSPQDRIHVAYARVSSHDQKSDLNRQRERLVRYCEKKERITNPYYCETIQMNGAFLSKTGEKNKWNEPSN